MTRIGLSLYRIAPFIVNGPDHVAPWSVDLKRTLPGSNVCRKTTYTVPSAATWICGSNCQPRPRAIDTGRAAPQVAPPSADTRRKIAVPGQPEQVFEALR